MVQPIPPPLACSLTPLPFFPLLSVLGISLLSGSAACCRALLCTGVSFPLPAFHRSLSFAMCLSHSSLVYCATILRRWRRVNRRGTRRCRDPRTHIPTARERPCSGAALCACVCAPPLSPPVATAISLRTAYTSTHSPRSAALRARSGPLTRLWQNPVLGSRTWTIRCVEASTRHVCHTGTLGFLAQRCSLEAVRRNCTGASDLLDNGRPSRARSSTALDNRGLDECILSRFYERVR